MKKPRVTKPMCAIDEYAISFFMSVCTRATKPMYTTAISDSAIMSQSSCMARVGRDRQAETQEAVAAHLQHDGRQHHRTAGGRLHVGIRQPGMHRPHRHLDRERR